MDLLETERLCLRRLSPDDVENLLGIFADPIAMRFYPGTKNAEETRRWIDWNLDSYERHGFGLLAAELRESRRFAGQVGLVAQDVAGARETEVGYLFRREYWGQGLATEAARACCEFGFSQLGKPRLISLIHPGNRASRRVAERVGMRLQEEISKWGRRVCLYAAERPAGAAFRAGRSRRS